MCTTSNPDNFYKFLTENQNIMNKTSLVENHFKKIIQIFFFLVLCKKQIHWIRCIILCIHIFYPMYLKCVINKFTQNSDDLVVDFGFVSICVKFFHLFYWIIFGKKERKIGSCVKNYASSIWVPYIWIHSKILSLN